LIPEIQADTSESIFQVHRPLERLGCPKLLTVRVRGWPRRRDGPSGATQKMDRKWAKGHGKGNHNWKHHVHPRMPPAPPSTSTPLNASSTPEHLYTLECPRPAARLPSSGSPYLYVLRPAARLPSSRAPYFHTLSEIRIWSLVRSSRRIFVYLWSSYLYYRFKFNSIPSYAPPYLQHQYTYSMPLESHASMQ
jgi:hypothetical protein